MALVMRLLRPNSLIWRYFVHNYLQGELPPKSEFLYWNTDSTRLPAAMMSYYLRELYMNNGLTKEDEITLGHQPVDLRRIEQPLYAVGAEQDHICPWTETFKICGLVRGPVRYTLSDEGHITGIVNPPSERFRRKFRSGEAHSELTAEEWYLNRQTRKGSWWGDWVRWLLEQSDSRRTPPAMGSEKYPPLERAPGTYVMEK
jgi:polyhydroxyalkanoate synthase